MSMTEPMLCRRPQALSRRRSGRAARPAAWLVGGLATVTATVTATATATVAAETAQAAPATPPPPTIASADAVAASIASIGLEIRFPAGTVVGRQETPGGDGLSAVGGGSPPRWSVLVQPIPASVDPPVARAQIEVILEAQAAAGIMLEPIRDRRVAVAGRLGHLVLLRDAVDRHDRYVALAAVPRGPSDRGMLLYSGRGVDEESLDAAMQAILAGTSLRGVEDVSWERGERLARGRAFLGGLDRDGLNRLVGPGQWYRTYRIAEDGTEVEVGCMLVEVLPGVRGMVDPTRDPEQYSMAERDPGLLVRVAGRFPVTDGMIRSSQAVHWMAWDQSSEQWSVVATVRDGRNSDSEALTGVREPRSGASPRGSITVLTARERGAVEPPAIWPVPDALLSQPVRWMLGELLAASSAPPGMYAWYAVDASAGRPDLTYREDEWRPAEDGSGWVILSRPSPGAAPIVSTHDASGRLLRRVTPAGLRTEPIELAELLRLWRSKGLPTGPIESRPRR